jgi:hypothetical protein
MRAGVVVATLVATAATAVGCGDGDADQVRATVTAFRDATADGDYHAICDRILAPGLARRLADLGLPCEVAVARFLSGTRAPRIAVGRVRVRGDRAEASVRSSAAGQPPSSDVVRVLRAGDGWRIASLGR